MGMHTELVLAVDLPKNTPDEVIQKIQEGISGEGEFRWLHHDSYYFRGDTHCSIRQEDLGDYRNWEVTIRCNCKNYQHQIQSFCDWLCNHLENTSYFRFMGYERYEEAESPTLIYMRKNEVEYVTTLSCLNRRIRESLYA